jgi:hypothetical protein
VEIVGAEPSLLFDTAAQAVERITAVLLDPRLERRLFEHGARRRELFTVAAFCSRLREIVREF